jgi:hypothetical protein
MTKRVKSLEESLRERADLDLLSPKDALDVFEKFIIHTPNRAMIFEKDGYSVTLISKRELLDNLKRKESQP